MPRVHHVFGSVWGWAILAVCMVCASCELSHDSLDPRRQDVPHELTKVSQSPYVIESPDTLLIDAVRLVPRPPYRIEPLDVVNLAPIPRIPYQIAPFDLLELQVTGTLPNEPIAGIYPVEPTGAVNLRKSYGSVPVKTIKQLMMEPASAVAGK